jgi:hypothetical protein
MNTTTTLPDILKYRVTALYTDPRASVPNAIHGISISSKATLISLNSLRSKTLKTSIFVIHIHKIQELQYPHFHSLRNPHFTHFETPLSLKSKTLPQIRKPSLLLRNPHISSKPLLLRFNTLENPLLKRSL